MHCHCCTNNRVPSWTFIDPCKPELRPGAREESASPAWLAAPATLRNVYGVGSPTVGTTSSSVRLHICAVTYMTEISLHVALNNQSDSSDKSNTTSVSPACRKRRLNWAVCWNHRIKRVVPCRCRTGTLKNPAKYLWRWEPYVSSTSSIRLYICAVTYMTEISLNVT